VYRFFRLVLHVILIFFSQDCLSQFIDLESGKPIELVSDDELSPAWSSDSQKLLFQSNKDGNWDIFLYHLAKDSIEQLTKTPYNEKNPVWYKENTMVVFDSDHSGKRLLYRMNLTTGKIVLLFDRDIPSKHADFSPSEDIVYFSGFDKLNGKWEIYSYEFKYQNLNKLTHLKFSSYSPKVSPDEDHVIFTITNQTLPFDQLQIMNWYGSNHELLYAMDGKDASWSNSGIKVYFVSENKSGTGEIYSIWKDGTHLERLTDWNLKICKPVKSPDDKFFAVSIKQDDGFDLFLFPAEDY